MNKKHLTRSATALILAAIPFAGYKKDPNPVEANEPEITATRATKEYTFLATPASTVAIVALPLPKAGLCIWIIKQQAANV